MAWPNAASRPRESRRRNGPSLALGFLYAGWAVMLFDLHFWLGTYVASPLGRLGVVMYLPLIVLVAVQGPALFASARSWVWYPALMSLLVAGLLGAPFAINLGAARSALQLLLIYYALAVSTLVLVRSARESMPIVLMMGFQFIWWAINARFEGVVAWHPSRANQNDFAGLMVMGVGICFWFATGARRRSDRWMLIGLATYCIAGVVVTYARGAFLSLLVVIGWILLRSRRKLLVLGGFGLAGLAATTVAITVLPKGLFVSEMRSIFEEGNETGTGGKRWSHWQAAMKVWWANPVLGTGAANFGIYASRFFRDGEVPYFENPATLYQEQLHNTYVQILSEFGLVGALAFIWILVDFQRRNGLLRRREAEERWRVRTGGRFRLGDIARGLEAANIANLLSGLFYSSFLYSNFYTVWALNQLLWAVTRPDPVRLGEPQGVVARTKETSGPRVGTARHANMERPR